jgi:hypothetical protein
MYKVAGAVMSLGLIFGAASCGRVDKEGTAENLIKSFEEANGSPLADDQKSCITDLVKSYSDEDLKALDDQSASSELMADFTGKALDCLAGTGS